MNAFLSKGKQWFGKAALATVALGGFLMFFGAGSASARPPQRFRATVVARPYFAHRAYYGVRVYRPAYRPYYRPYYRHYAHRYWDERFECWRYR